MIKNSINEILWHVVRFECLVGIKILKYEFWPFLQQTEKNLVTAITFAYDVGKMRFIYQKKTTEKSEFDFTGIYPVSNSQILQIPKEKNLFQTDDFFPTKSKKFKKFKKFKKK